MPELDSKNVQNQDRDFLSKVIKDLTYLRNNWQEVSDMDTVEMTGAILSRLINEGSLKKSGQMLDMPIKVYAFTPHAGYIDEDGIISSQNAGANFNGIQIAGVQTSTKPFTASFPAKPSFEPILITDYLKRSLIRYSGVELFPEEIIIYVRNKLGSVHYDTTRNPNKARDMKFAALDELQNQSKLLEQGPVWIEFLSIGQAIVRSQHIRRLERKIQNILK